jgi:hypothetical protein
MKTCDLYGFRNDDLEAAKLAVERSLGVRLAAHESLYLGGNYYRLGGLGGEHFILRRNIDLLDDEPAELEFPEIGILLYVNETEQARDLEQILTAKIEGLLLLRREELDLGKHPKD